jgi:hypothetical protein
MIVQRIGQENFLSWEIDLITNNYHSRHNKGDTINVTKTMASKSILMQITKARVANRFY